MLVLTEKRLTTVTKPRLCTMISLSVANVQTGPWCEAYASGGSATVTCHFPRDINSSQLSFSVVRCIDEKPVVGCSWLDEGQMQCYIEQGYRFNRKVSDQLEVEIPQANSQTHDSNYSCKAVGEVLPGEEPVQCTLNISGAPGPPTELRVQSTSLESARVCWKPPPDKGQQVSYRIRYRQITSGKGNTTDVCPFDVSCFSVTGLTPGTGYDISVRAFNRFGESEYEDVVAKTLSTTPLKDSYTLAVVFAVVFAVLFGVAVLVIVYVCRKVKRLKDEASTPIPKNQYCDLDRRSQDQNAHKYETVDLRRATPDTAAPEAENSKQEAERRPSPTPSKKISEDDQKLEETVIETTCKTFVSGTTAKVTCHFTEDLNASQADFSLRYNSSQTATIKPVMNCNWEENRMIFCGSETEYILNNGVSDRFEVEIRNANSKDHDGQYTCRLISQHNFRDTFNPCTLNMAGVPGPPTKLHVQNETLESVKVCWKRLPDKGQQVSYRARYRPSNSGMEYITANFCCPADDCVVITGKYQNTCYA
ncbi:hypothetical protein BaRGS_00013407 [Batillaria attramentaria]|uniref:Fibronectin type-III domain-containing protein n=1 Tax=Batillaria attramentaria TaxID=370345 RepID=A0ABD0L873_9CAEN